MFPFEFAAPTTIAAGPVPTRALATAKWFVEPVLVVLESAVTTLTQMAPIEDVQSWSRTIVWIGSSGPWCDWPWLVSTLRISLPASDRIVMWPWYLLSCAGSICAHHEPEE